MKKELIEVREQIQEDLMAYLDGIDEAVGNKQHEIINEVCKIYLYTSRLHSVEDVIRALIHECVHSTQSKVKFDAYYLCGETYDTHPYEIEARNAEEEWTIYLNELEY